jgi:hypothetical protein
MDSKTVLCTGHLLFEFTSNGLERQLSPQEVPLSEVVKYLQEPEANIGIKVCPCSIQTRAPVSYLFDQSTKDLPH